MALHVHETALQLITEIKPLLASIARHDRNLANQLRRAATSVCLNIAEGEYSDPGTKRARFRSAAGSAGETRSALRVAMAWDYVKGQRVLDALDQLDRVIATLWKLTH